MRPERDQLQGPKLPFHFDIWRGIMKNQLMIGKVLSYSSKLIFHLATYATNRRKVQHGIWFKYPVKPRAGGCRQHFVQLGLIYNQQLKLNRYGKFTVYCRCYLGYRMADRVCRLPGRRNYPHSIGYSYSLRFIESNSGKESLGEF